MITSQPVKQVVMYSQDGTSGAVDITEGQWTKLFGGDTGSGVPDSIKQQLTWRKENLGSERADCSAVRIVNLSATETLAVSYCTFTEFDNAGDLRFPGPALSYGTGHVRGLIPPGSVWEDQISLDNVILVGIFNPSAPGVTATAAVYVTI